MDLLRMRKGLYHPYWLADDKKTILDLTTKEAKQKYAELIQKVKAMKLQPIPIIKETEED
jgi:hypothetical protein